MVWKSFYLQDLIPTGDVTSVMAANPVPTERIFPERFVPRPIGKYQPGHRNRIVDLTLPKPCSKLD